MSMQCQWFHPPSMLELLPGEVHVWHASTNVDQEQFKYLYEIISEEEQKRAAKFYFQKDRTRFIVARGYLRMILAYYLDQSPKEFQFDYNRYGKPSLQSIGHNDMRFNLSHSNEMILYGFTRCREIGVDVELISSSEDSIQILDRFFSESEKQEFKNIPEQNKKEAFYTCWTRKEAYIKARGKGLSIPLDHFSVSLHPGYPAMLIKADKDSEVSQWYMKDISVASGYAAAAVVSGAEPSFYYLDAMSLLNKQTLR